MTILVTLGEVNRVEWLTTKFLAGPASQSSDGRAHQSGWMGVRAMLTISSSRDGLSATCENGMWSIPCLFESSEGLCEAGTFVAECYTPEHGVNLWREPSSGSTISLVEFCYASGWGRRSGECAVLRIESAAFRVIVPADLWARVCESEQMKVW